MRSNAIEIIQTVDHVHDVVGDMIRRLPPVGLDQLGLVAAINGVEPEDNCQPSIFHQTEAGRRDRTSAAAER